MRKVSPGLRGSRRRDRVVEDTPKTVLQPGSFGTEGRVVSRKHPGRVRYTLVSLSFTQTSPGTRGDPSPRLMSCEPVSDSSRPHPGALPWDDSYDESAYRPHFPPPTVVETTRLTVEGREPREGTKAPFLRFDVRVRCSGSS